VILLNRPEGLVPTAVKVHDQRPDEPIVLASSMIETAVREKRALLSYDALRDPRFDRSPSIHAQGIRSAMCVPLVYKDKLHGVLHLDTSRAVGAFTEKDLQLLSGIATQAAIALENAFLGHELKQSEARFRMLIESMPDMMAVLRQGRFVYVNPALLRGLGYPRPEDLLGEPLDRVLAGDSDLPEVAARGDVVSLREERLRKRDGGVVMVEISSLPVVLDGSAAVAMLARDVTERKQMQARLLQADRMVSVGTLAAGVAHEINNPLAYVMANLEYVHGELPKLATALRTAETAFPPEARAAGGGVLGRFGDVERALLECSEGAERVRTIVKDLKTFSRADEEWRGPVDVRRVLDSSISMAWNEIRPRARLTKEYGDAPQVEANEARLGQVFLNLLVNAAQAIREGNAKNNEIRVVTSTDALGRAVVEVSDTGAGIPPEIRSRVFDPFFTTKPLGVGTGLGLSICHGIVTSLGGEIQLASEIGRGTTFRVLLPAALPGPAPTPVEELETAVGPSPRSRILVVDDEPHVADALGRALGEHEVLVAASGSEALALLREDARFDAIFCDLIMADVAGMDLYEELRRSQPGLERRLVFMTGGAFTPRAREFLEQVPNPRIDKPFDLRHVRALLRDTSWAGG
jgi:PAS domain S-box-containing protein